MRKTPERPAWKPFVWLLLTLPFFSCGGGQAQEQSQTSAPPEKKQLSELDSLRHWLGKRPAEVDLWAYPPLRDRLADLLGEEDFEEFVSYMQEAMPLTAADGLVYTVGVVPDDAVRGIAYLLVMPDAGRLRAFGVFGDYRLEAQSDGPDIPVPEPVQKRVEAVLNLEL